MTKRPTKKTILKALEAVLDPELGISIVALGLIYDVTINREGRCHITMTLTTMGCPLFGAIQKDIENRIMAVSGIEDVETDLTFDPPWSTQKMSPEARIQLGLD